MTIIRPAQYRGFISFFVIIFGLIIISSVFYIFEYNSFVESSTEIKALKKRMVEFQALNADLKNAFYEATDVPTLEKIGIEHGLSLDKRPEYLNSNQWLSDSSY